MSDDSDVVSDESGEDEFGPRLVPGLVAISHRWTDVLLGLIALREHDDTGFIAAKNVISTVPDLDGLDRLLRDWVLWFYDRGGDEWVVAGGEEDFDAIHLLFEGVWGYVPKFPVRFEPDVGQ